MSIENIAILTDEIQHLKIRFYIQENSMMRVLEFYMQIIISISSESIIKDNRYEPVTISYNIGEKEMHELNTSSDVFHNFLLRVGRSLFDEVFDYLNNPDKVVCINNTTGVSVTYKNVEDLYDIVFYNQLKDFFINSKFFK